jgi:hypothetical protein
MPGHHSKAPSCRFVWSSRLAGRCETALHRGMANAVDQAMVLAYQAMQIHTISHRVGVEGWKGGRAEERRVEDE